MHLHCESKTFIFYYTNILPQVSPDGKSAYLAYLDSTYKSVHVQQVDPTTFGAVGSPYVTAGFEAGGLVAHNDGFALLTTVTATSSNSAELPPNDYPIVALIRYQNGAEAVCLFLLQTRWKLTNIFLSSGGPLSMAQEYTHQMGSLLPRISTATLSFPLLLDCMLRISSSLHILVGLRGISATLCNMLIRQASSKQSHKAVLLDVPTTLVLVSRQPTHHRSQVSVQKTKEPSG